MSRGLFTCELEFLAEGTTLARGGSDVCAARPSIHPASFVIKGGRLCNPRRPKPSCRRRASRIPSFLALMLLVTYTFNRSFAAAYNATEDPALPPSFIIPLHAFLKNSCHPRFSVERILLTPHRHSISPAANSALYSVANCAAWLGAMCPGVLHPRSCNRSG